MKVLAVHPGPLMYTKIFLRLEPLGLELVAQSARRAGHEVRLIDLQVESHRAFFRLIDAGGRISIAFSCNYLANIPEIVDLAQGAKGAAAAIVHLRRRAQRVVHRQRDPRAWRGRDRLRAARRGRSRRCRCLLAAIEAGDDLAARAGRGHRRRRGAAARLSSIRSTSCCRRATCCAIAANISSACSTPAPRSSSRAAAPGIARSAAPGRFMAAATGWSARSGSSRICGSIREPGVFIVDDVAFVQEQHGLEIGEAIARAGIREELLPGNARRRAAAQQGGVPLLEEARHVLHVPRAGGDRRRGPAKYRKRVPLGRNFEALEFARSLGINVAINLIADPDWDREQFRDRARVVPGNAGDHQYQRQHALSRYRELDHRGAPAADPRLPPVRHPACGPADAAAARRILPRSW